MTTLPGTKRWLALLLTSAAWLSTACDSTSSSTGDGAGDSGATPGEAGGSALDAAGEGDAPSAPDASDAASAADAPDAATCPALAMPIRTFDEMVAYLCTGHDAGYWHVFSGTVACDGLLAVVDTHGADAQDLYLFDPTTGELVESLSGNNGDLTCLGSATGVDRRTDPAFNACSLGFVSPTAGGGGGFGLQQACLDAGPGDAASEAGLTDAPHE